MIKYIKPVMILLTAVFIISGVVFFLPTGSETGIITQYETAEATPTPEHPDELLAGEKININTADKETLMQLKGIGEVLAERIIEYRSQNGAFATVDELVNVSGIGEKKLAAVYDCVYVE